MKAYSLSITLLLLLIPELILAVVAVILAVQLKTRCDFIYPVIYLSISIIIPLGCCVRKLGASFQDRDFNTSSTIFEFCSFKMTVFDGLILLSFFMTIHHLIWVLMGVVTDPAWGIPILVVVFSLFYCLYTLVYYNKRDLSKSHFWGMFFSLSLVIALAFLFVVLGVVAQVFLNRDPVASIFGGILVLLLSIWLNHFKKRNYKKREENILAL